MMRSPFLYHRTLETSMLTGTSPKPRTYLETHIRATHEYTPRTLKFTCGLRTMYTPRGYRSSHQSIRVPARHTYELRSCFHSDTRTSHTQTCTQGLEDVRGVSEVHLLLMTLHDMYTQIQALTHHTHVHTGPGGCDRCLCTIHASLRCKHSHTHTHAHAHTHAHTHTHTHPHTHTRTHTYTHTRAYRAWRMW